MSLLLNIDTATEAAYVSVARDGIILRSLNNLSQKDHASFLQVAIQQLTKDTGISLQELDAVAVTAGPGSYTGLRVGLASAKGICYALNKPLITLNTLAVWATAAILATKEEEALFCPMIDARRMEVFTAVYNRQLDIILPPCALVIDENSFAGLLQDHTILFFGNGAAKWQQVAKQTHARFTDLTVIPAAMSELAANHYDNHRFTALADSEPIYLKEFHMQGGL